MLSDPVVRKRVDCIDTHSYCTQLPVVGKLLNNRAAFVRRYGKWAQKKYPDLAVKMSEWTHMQGGRDYGIDSALEQAKIMLEDITLMNAASWQHWIAVSEVDFCDGLIYINVEDNSFELTKRYFAFGNFTKFVPIGAVRIACDCDDKDVKSAAFTNNGKIAVVAANFSNEEKLCDFGDVEGEVYVTDRENDLKKSKYKSLSSVSLPPRSVVTVLK